MHGKSTKKHNADKKHKISGDCDELDKSYAYGVDEETKARRTR